METCDRKHVWAKECPLSARFYPEGKLDLRRYSEAHPPHGGINFHEVLNYSARETALLARHRKEPVDKTKGRKTGKGGGFNAPIGFGDEWE